jgi:hypothetical protein
MWRLAIASNARKLLVLILQQTGHQFFAGTSFFLIRASLLDHILKYNKKGVLI